MANAALKSLSGEFQNLYSADGRESIPPERLIGALLLQAFYSIRSERQLVERIDTDLLFRWFVGLGIDDAVRDATSFTKNRDRLLDGEVSSEHFSVNGTVLEAWASPKSFRPKDGSGEPPGPGRNGERDFHGERRSNDTHASTTDPDARLFRKGPGKGGAAVFYWPRADGEPQRLDGHPHIAQIPMAAVRRSTAAPPAIRLHLSQRIRKRVKEAFGWAKTVAGCARCVIAAAQSRLAIHPRHGRLRPPLIAQIARPASGRILARRPQRHPDNDLPAPCGRSRMAHFSRRPPGVSQKAISLGNHRRFSAPW
jgi:hypothetical protein